MKKHILFLFFVLNILCSKLVICQGLFGSNKSSIEKKVLTKFDSLFPHVDQVFWFPHSSKDSTRKVMFNWAHTDHGYNLAEFNRNGSLLLKSRPLPLDSVPSGIDMYIKKYHSDYFCTGFADKETDYKGKIIYGVVVTIRGGCNNCDGYAMLFDDKGQLISDKPTGTHK